MSEVVTSSYKQKVLDSEMLQFCLGIIELSEFPFANSTMLRKALLDSLSFCGSIEHLMSYWSKLSQSLAAVKASSPEAVTSFELETLLNTASSLAGDNQNRLHDFLFTIYMLGEAKNFTSWKDFFSATKSLATMSEPKNLESFFVTIRLLAPANFTAWRTFFTACKKISLHEGSQIVFFESIRHSIHYFSAEESFSGIFRLLSERSPYTDAFAYGQLDSKKWLVDEAVKVWGKTWGETVFVLAGWVGLLPRMMYDQKVQTTKIRSFDQDAQANEASEIVNQFEVQKDWAYKSSTLDITKMMYPTTYTVLRKDGSVCDMEDAPDVVINTSCEHIKDIRKWWDQIPKGTRVILQSNDGFHIPEHVACFKSLHDFSQAMGLSRIDYAGEKDLPEFKRFMLIGEK